jgi:predicted enzyme related to lactoylglutathione lyase
MTTVPAGSASTATTATPRVEAPSPIALIRVAHLVLDCTDLDRLSAFWSQLLGLEVVSREADWCDLSALPGSGVQLSFQRADDRKTAIKNRLHLDLAVRDFAAATDRAAALGGTPAGDRQGDEATRWQVWRDPEGNEFCLCTG